MMNENKQNMTLSKAEGKKLIPELRFPEFQNDEEWVRKHLSDLLEYERPDKYIVSDTNYRNEGIPVLTANKAFVLGYTNENFGIYENLPAIIFDDFTTDKKYVDFPFKVKSSAIKILTAKGNNNLKFIYELMSQIRFDAIQHKRYYISQYQNLKVPVPNVPEQQKIADFLSNLDELIAAHKQKLQLLKQHKKGLMQKLFPQEGKKLPEWRFPEFQNDGEWVVKKLGEVLIKNSSKNKKMQYSLVQSVSNKYGFVNQDEYFDNRMVASKNTSNYYVIKKGCFAYNPSRIDVGSLAYKFDNDVSIISPLYVSFYANNDKVDDIFLLNWFFTERFTGQMIFEGGVRNTLSYQTLIQMKIPIPTLPEQQKIADFLSNLDELITAQAEKIEQLEQHKKGLMQRMFPEVNV